MDLCINVESQPRTQLYVWPSQPRKRAEQSDTGGPRRGLCELIDILRDLGRRSIVFATGLEYGGIVLCLRQNISFRRSSAFLPLRFSSSRYVVLISDYLLVTASLHSQDKI